MNTEFLTVGRPGAIGSRKTEVFANYDVLYGKYNWQLIWDVDGTALYYNQVMNLCEDAYLKHFKNRHGKFMGKKDYGRIPFHKPELILKPEIKGEWLPGSIESFHQSCLYLEAATRPEIKDAYLINSQRANLAGLLRDDFSLGQISLDISEDKDSIHKILDHKARVAYSVLCQPVICDYSGKRSSLEKKCCSIYGLSYFDETLPKPKIFISKAERDECSLDDNQLAENSWKELVEFVLSRDRKEQKVINPHCVDI